MEGPLEQLFTGWWRKLSSKVNGFSTRKELNYGDNVGWQITISFTRTPKQNDSRDLTITHINTRGNSTE